MTREPVTCGCGAVLKDSYPSAITAHGETKRHVAWVTAKYAPDEMPGEDGPELLPVPVTRNEGETAAAFIERVEANGGQYASWVSSDEGQAVIAEAAADDKEARKATAKAELREKILAAKERDREAVLARQAGPVEIIQPPTNGKPTKAARAAGVKPAPEEKPMRARRLNDPRRTELPTRTYAIVDGKLVPDTKPVNKPLKIGDTPIELDGVKRYPLLHRDGAIADHQGDNYPWLCPVDRKRTRAAACPDHPDQKAPQGYRADDRIVR